MQQSVRPPPPPLPPPDATCAPAPRPAAVAEAAEGNIIVAANGGHGLPQSAPLMRGVAVPAVQKKH